MQLYYGNSRFNTFAFELGSYSERIRNWAINCLVPDKPGKLAECIPIHGTILGQCTRKGANAGPIFLFCQVIIESSIYVKLQNKLTMHMANSRDLDTTLIIVLKTIILFKIKIKLRIKFFHSR